MVVDHLPYHLIRCKLTQTHENIKIIGPALGLQCGPIPKLIPEKISHKETHWDLECTILWDPLCGCVEACQYTAQSC